MDSSAIDFYNVLGSKRGYFPMIGFIINASMAVGNTGAGAPGSYNLTVTSNSYTFADPAASKTVGPSSANFTDISITATGTP